MMQRSFLAFLAAFALSTAMLGCSNSGGDSNGGGSSPSSSPSNGAGEKSEGGAALKERTSDPKSAVNEFLTAAYLNNQQDQARHLLTEQARATIPEGLPFEPAQSRNARFQIIDVKAEGSDKAFVKTTLIDYSMDGKECVDDPSQWILKKTPDGWRISGAVITFLHGMDPILIDLENPTALEQAAAEKSRQEVAFAKKQFEAMEAMQQRTPSDTGTAPAPPGFGDIPMTGSVPGGNLHGIR